MQWVKNDLNQVETEKEKRKKPKSPKRKINILEETFVQFFQRTDINAIGKIFEYENFFVKFIWLIVLLGSLSLTAWVMSWSVVAYLKYGVVSQIGVLYETPTEFPAVTFCDNNPFTTNVSLPVFSQNGGLRKNIINGRMFASNPSYGDDNRKQLGLNFSQINNQFSYCSYNNIDCKNDLHWYWSYDYGNCFQFNVGLNISNQNIDMQQSYIPDPDYGLQISLFPMVYENIHTTYSAEGIVVFVHNASLRPRKSDGIFIKLGEQSLISVKRNFVINANSPYTDCQDLTAYSSHLYNFIINSKQYSKYRQQDCFNLCIQQSIIEQCNCSFSGFDSLNSTVGPCLSYIDYKCYTNVFFEFDPNECASNSCPLECEYIDYDLTVSSLSYPPYGFYEKKSQGSFCSAKNYDYLCLSTGTIDYETFKNYFATFTVFYSSPSYTLLETSPAMTLVDLIANLSGTMGVIVSVSLFTLFEMVEFILLMIHALIFKK